MVESSDDPPLLDRIRAKLHVFGPGPANAQQPPILPLNCPQGAPTDNSTGNNDPRRGSERSQTVRKDVADEEKAPRLPFGPLPTSGAPPGENHSTIEPNQEKRSMAARFIETAKGILTYSIINVLLVFVPVGIAVANAGVNEAIVFAINAIALIPLAGLLAHATEAVAGSLGDTIGALLNVTFGNAVELIVMIIAITKHQIRIVQASIVGSILSNLLLILGMAFALGGLRYREQIYNSTVTQMSACLLSLSVTSLLLPTAFHASFSSNELADDRVLELSRASAIILLIIYLLYLVFQLKSHSYMYESTPQHLIDEESHPGVLANMLNSSSSSDSSSSGDSDSDSSAGSHTTAKKIRQALRGGRRHRKPSASSKEAPSVPSTAPNQSFTDIPGALSRSSNGSIQHVRALASGDEADTDENSAPRKSRIAHGTKTHDFGTDNSLKGTRRSRKRSKNTEKIKEKQKVHPFPSEGYPTTCDANQQPRVSFISQEQPVTEVASKRPLNLRTLSSVRPTMPRFLGSTVFSESNPTGKPAPAGVAVPRAPYGLRRTSSLPDRLNRPRSQANDLTQQDFSNNHHNASPGNQPSDNEEGKKHMSRTSAILLLVVSTGLVALCAEYMVGSIDYMVDKTPLSQVFIGLIILPIVGNAAEHVTAVTVAMKNKMDLSIGVAVGSSIQIALFVTPLVILLAWWIGEELSLFFSLFETISLFVSAFLINFLILDGRSNYLEGALLIAAYIIIAVAAWFYPSSAEQSVIGGFPNESEQANQGKMLMTRGLSLATGWHLE